LFNIVYASDSFEPILSLLAPRVENAIAVGRGLPYLYFLLEFLAAWNERPALLAPMAYKWCSAIFEVIERFEMMDPKRGLNDYATPNRYLFDAPSFHTVGPYCDRFHRGGTPRRFPPFPEDSKNCLSKILAIVLRQVDPDPGGLALRLDHVFRSNRTLETIFSSDDDETIADAVCIWILGDSGVPPGSLARYLARRVERAKPFSPRLRRVAIRAIERIGQRGLEVSGLATIRLLNRLQVDMHEISDKRTWTKVLISAIRSPAGAKNLSSQCWRLFHELLKIHWWFPRNFTRDLKVTKSLEDVGDWEILEAWLTFIWWGEPTSKSMEDIGRVTLKLLLHQPSALPRFEDMRNKGKLWEKHRGLLQQICDKARAEPLPLKCLPRPWVTFCFTQHLFVLTLFWPSQSIDATPLASLHFGGDDTF
jgi:hypothetical protein